MNKTKTNIISGFLTILIVGLLLLSGSVKAIDVDVITEDIYPSDIFKTFIIKIKVNDGEFLPIPFVDLNFNDGVNEITCRIKDNNSSCDFLNISVETEDLSFGYGYGYGYSYGYGYGYTTHSPGYYIYTVTIDTSKLPESFIGKNINLKVKVFGSDDSSYNTDSSFNVFVQKPTIDYGSGGLSNSFYSVGNPDDITRATPKTKVEDKREPVVNFNEEPKEEPKVTQATVTEKNSNNPRKVGLIVLAVFVIVLGYFTFRKPKGGDILSK